MEPRSRTSASASRVLSASASARVSAAAACWFFASSARCRALSTSCRTRASSFWQMVSSSPRRANSLCIWPWRCMAEMTSRSASRCFSSIGATAGDHTAMVAGAVGGDEGILGVFLRQFFRCSRAVRQIRGAQPWQELLCRRAERIAELHQLVEPGDDAVFRAEIHDRLVFGGKTQVPKRVDQESGAATHFIPGHGDTGPRGVVSFDDDIFQFVAKGLLDSRFMLLCDFGVIGKHADGAKILAAAALVGGKKLLNGVRGVRAVVQDLREGGMARANARKRIAEGCGLPRQSIALLSESGNLDLQLCRVLFQRIELTGSGFVLESGAFGIITRAHGSFQQVLLACFQLSQCFGLVYERFFGLLLLAMQPQKTFAGFR